MSSIFHSWVNLGNPCPFPLSKEPQTLDLYGALVLDLSAHADHYKTDETEKAASPADSEQPNLYPNQLLSQRSPLRK